MLFNVLQKVIESPKWSHFCYQLHAYANDFLINIYGVVPPPAPASGAAPPPFASGAGFAGLAAGGFTGLAGFAAGGLTGLAGFAAGELTGLAPGLFTGRATPGDVALDGLPVFGFLPYKKICASDYDICSKKRK